MKRYLRQNLFWEAQSENKVIYAELLGVNKNPVLHGPYNYLSHRYNNKGQTLFLNDKKLRLSKKRINNYKKIIDLKNRIKRNEMPENFITIKADIKGRLFRLLNQFLDHYRADKLRKRF